MPIVEADGLNLVCAGSIDDLLSTNGSSECGHCGKQLIRLAMIDDELDFGATHSYFQSGIIYCPYIIEEEPRSHEYWIEVWPDANRALREDAGQEASSTNQLRLSNPAIKPCYDITWFLFGTLKGSQLLTQERYGSPLPDPTYVHK